MPTYLVTDDLPYELDDDTRPLRFLRTVEPGELGGQSVEDYFDAQGLRVIKELTDHEVRQCKRPPRNFTAPTTPSPATGCTPGTAAPENRQSLPLADALNK